MKKLKEERKKIRQRVQLRHQGIGGTQPGGPLRGKSSPKLKTLAEIVKCRTFTSLIKVL